MKTTVLEPETWKRAIEFEVSAEEIDTAIGAKLEKYRKDARLPGFRQGKVPLHEIRRRFGEAARAEVVEETVQNSYKSACAEHKIEPVSAATMTDIKNEEGQPLRFTLETEVDPPVEIQGYDKLKIKVKEKKITDADVEENFNSLLDRLAEFKDVDRKSKKGDFVRIEYRKVTIDGEERADIKTPAYPFEIGAAGALKEFDKGLTGVSADDEVDITVKFPKDYADASAAGKTGEFAITVTSVQEKVLPEVNEALLKRLGDFDSVDALKAEMRKNLEESAKLSAAKEAHGEAIDTLIKNNPFEVPPSKISQFVDMMIEDYAQAAGGKVNEPIEQLRELYKSSAVMALKRIRIVDYIAEKEKIKATQEEVDAEIKILAQRYGHDFDQMKQLFRKNGTTNRIRLEIREKKTLDFLVGAN